MDILMQNSASTLWQHVIDEAKNRVDITITPQAETYLVNLLMRYTNQPDIANTVMATAFLEALNSQRQLRHLHLQAIGDQCLLFAGLFPQRAQRKRVSVSYFVDLGRSSYAAISEPNHQDLFWHLTSTFVDLMDILQSIKQSDLLTPLEAFDQWQSLGSKRALQMLRLYTNATPLKPKL